jgi:hypothetical protein
MSYDDLLNLPLSAYTPGQGDPRMEGGRQTASGAPMFTLEDYLRLLGTSQALPYVTGATNVSPPSGAMVTRQIGGHSVPVKITDYGPGVGGLDIASSNPRYATDFPYQGQKGGSGADTSQNDPTNFGSDLAQGMGAGTSFDKGFDNKALGKAITSSARESGQKASQLSQEGTQKAMQMIYKREKDPRLQALMQVADPFAQSSMAGGGAESAAMRQLFDKYFGPTPTQALYPNFQMFGPMMG